METEAQRVSKKSDNITWCLPSEGYNKYDAIKIELDDYEEIDTVQGELPENDEKFPKGDRMSNYAKVGDKILMKKAKNDLA
jgi:hypothetical protein